MDPESEQSDRRKQRYSKLNIPVVNILEVDPKSQECKDAQRRDRRARQQRERRKNMTPEEKEAYRKHHREYARSYRTKKPSTAEQRAEAALQRRIRMLNKTAEQLEEYRRSNRESVRRCKERKTSTAEQRAETRMRIAIGDDSSCSREGETESQNMVSSNMQSEEESSSHLREPKRSNTSKLSLERRAAKALTAGIVRKINKDSTTKEENELMKTIKTKPIDKYGVIVDVGTNDIEEARSFAKFLLAKVNNHSAVIRTALIKEARRIEFDPEVPVLKETDGTQSATGRSDAFAQIQENSEPCNTNFNYSDCNIGNQVSVDSVLQTTSKENENIGNNENDYFFDESENKRQPNESIEEWIARVTSKVFELNSSCYGKEKTDITSISHKNKSTSTSEETYKARMFKIDVFITENNYKKARRKLEEEKSTIEDVENRKKLDQQRRELEQKILTDKSKLFEKIKNELAEKLKKFANETLEERTTRINMEVDQRKHFIVKVLEGRRVYDNLTTEEEKAAAKRERSKQKYNIRKEQGQTKKILTPEEEEARKAKNAAAARTRTRMEKHEYTLFTILENCHCFEIFEKTMKESQNVVEYWGNYNPAFVPTEIFSYRQRLAKLMKMINSSEEQSQIEKIYNNFKEFLTKHYDTIKQHLWRKRNYCNEYMKLRTKQLSAMTDEEREKFFQTGGKHFKKIRVLTEEEKEQNRLRFNAAVRYKYQKKKFGIDLGLGAYMVNRVKNRNSKREQNSETTLSPGPPLKKPKRTASASSSVNKNKKSKPNKIRATVKVAKTGEPRRSTRANKGTRKRQESSSSTAEESLSGSNPHASIGSNSSYEHSDDHGGDDNWGSFDVETDVQNSAPAALTASLENFGMHNSVMLNQQVVQNDFHQVLTQSNANPNYHYQTGFDSSQMMMNSQRNYNLYPPHQFNSNSIATELRYSQSQTALDNLNNMPFLSLVVPPNHSGSTFAVNIQNFSNSSQVDVADQSSSYSNNQTANLSTWSDTHQQLQTAPHENYLSFCQPNNTESTCSIESTRSEIISTPALSADSNAIIDINENIPQKPRRRGRPKGTIKSTKQRKCQQQKNLTRQNFAKKVDNAMRHYKEKNNRVIQPIVPNIEIVEKGLQLGNLRPRCTKCDTFFKSERELNLHLSSKTCVDIQIQFNISSLNLVESDQTVDDVNPIDSQTEKSIQEHDVEATKKRKRNKYSSPYTWRCQICNLILMIQSPEHVTKHIEDVHFEQPIYYCPICPENSKGKKILRTGRNLKGHIFRYHNRKTYVLGVHSQIMACDAEDFICFCRKLFKNYLDLVEHFLEVHEKENYCCDYCGILLRQPDLLCDHVKLFHPNEPSISLNLRKIERNNIFKCDVCDSGFISLEHIEKHKSGNHQLLTSTKETTKFKCSVCNKQFLKKASINMHIPRCIFQNYTCVWCRKRLPSKAILKNHLEENHSEHFTESNKPVLCQYSGKLTIPEDFTPPNIYDPYKCELCRRSYVSVFKLRQHFFHEHDLAEYLQQNLQEDVESQLNVSSILRLELENDMKQITTSAEKIGKDEKKGDGKDFTNSKMIDDIQCPECNENFSANDFHQAHKDYRLMLGKYCKECNRSFSKNYVLWIHNRSAHGIHDKSSPRNNYTYDNDPLDEEGIDQSKIFSCLKCPLQFTPQQFHRHHTFFKKTCKRCNMNYICTYIKHRSECSHSSTKVASASASKKVLQLSEQDYENLSTSTTIASAKGSLEIWTCGSCLKNFKTRDFLRKHISDAHSHDAFSRELCELCNRTFASKNNLQKHKKFYHKKNKLSYQCGICSSICARLDHFRVHMRKKHNVVNFEVSTVKRVPNAKGLQVQDEENGANKLFCDLCDRTFLSEDKLKTHRSNQHFKIHFTTFCEYCGLQVVPEEMNGHTTRVHGAQPDINIKKKNAPSTEATVVPTEPVAASITIQPNSTENMPVQPAINLDYYKKFPKKRLTLAQAIKLVQLSQQEINQFIQNSKKSSINTKSSRNSSAKQNKKEDLNSSSVEDCCDNSSTKSESLLEERIRTNKHKNSLRNTFVKPKKKILKRRSTTKVKRGTTLKKENHSSDFDSNDNENEDNDSDFEISDGEKDPVPSTLTPRKSTRRRTQNLKINLLSNSPLDNVDIPEEDANVLEENCAYLIKTEPMTSESESEDDGVQLNDNSTDESPVLFDNSRIAVIILKRCDHLVKIKKSSPPPPQNHQVRKSPRPRRKAKELQHLAESPAPVNQKINRLSMPKSQTMKGSRNSKRKKVSRAAQKNSAIDFEPLELSPSVCESENFVVVPGADEEDQQHYMSEEEVEAYVFL